MTRTYYLIRTYDMVGETLHTFNRVDFIEDPKVEMRGDKIKSISGETEDGEVIHNMSSYVSISTKEIGYDEKTTEFLPYFADVTQDLPGYVLGKPETFKGCQLLVETRGGYKYFWHSPTQQKLLIAINSNSYEPIKETKRYYESPSNIRN